MVKEGFLREIQIVKLCTARCVHLCIWLVVKTSKKQSVVMEETVMENSASGTVTRCILSEKLQLKGLTVLLYRGCEPGVTDC